jgi:hypothetical protein
MSKGKGHPARGRGGPRGSGWVKAPDFLDVRHYKGGRSSAIRTGRLYLRRKSWYSFSEAESAPGPTWFCRETRTKSPVTPPGIDPGTVRLVARRLNHYATPGPRIMSNDVNRTVIFKNTDIAHSNFCEGVRTTWGLPNF